MYEVYAMFWDMGEKEKCVDSMISREFSGTDLVLLSVVL